MSAFVIVNPRSAIGNTRRDWRSLEPALASVYPYMSVAFTRRRGEATALVAAALREGHSEIVAVGSDGTMNEVVNGFFDAEGSVSPDAVLTFVSSGYGSDFKKAFGHEDTGLDPIQHLKQAHVRPIDVGRVSFLSKDGHPRTRYFANIASFGFSGMVVDAVNRSSLTGLFGASFAFCFHSVAGLLRYRGRAARLIVDSVFDEIVNISTVAVANGRVFGAGMQVAPDAKPDDGQFDVVVIDSGPTTQMLADMKLIHTGEHLGNPNVRVVRGRRIIAAPIAETRGRPVLIETDGECVGRLPATFEILPCALNVRW
jgi:YegS/Rv2252/BmrU family lipid kinase